MATYKVLNECPDDWTKCAKMHPDLIVEINTEVLKTCSLKIPLSVNEYADALQCLSLRTSIPEYEVKRIVKNLGGNDKICKKMSM